MMLTRSKTGGPVRRMPSRLAVIRQFIRFRREEDGSMIIFSMFLLIMMLIVGGMAVDMMHFESTRARLQATLDRAVLAASDLEQTQDAEAVVRDYFAKAGLLDQITSITVTESVNSRQVSAVAAMNVDTMFMQLVGVESLLAPASGTAIENVSDIEIVLVLDVSGSMGSNSRIINLRSAAREFVRSVLANDINNRISITIVPFNAQVNIGPVLRARYNVVDPHGIVNSDCLDLPAAVYSVPGISTALAIPQAGYFDARSSTSQSISYIAPQTINTGNIFCRTEVQNIVRLPSRNIATLEAQIQGLTANGNTSITMGMKWGMALIDPGSRAMFSALIAGGQMAGNLDGRPYDYNRANTLKVVVLMTDGEHVASDILNAGYRSGLSPIYRSPGDNAYSLFHDRPATTSDYWVPSRNEWRTEPWNSGGGVAQLTWPQVWQNVRVTWVAWTLYARAIGTDSATRTAAYNTWMTNFRSMTNVPNMNATLQQSCALARLNGVVVYGIAFEAPTNGQTQIAGCASSPAHYFNAQGLQITAAFRAIASQINSLRLIQ